MTPWRDPRTGLVVHKPLQRRTRLRNQSVKLARLRRTYAKLRESFLTDNPVCSRCESARATDLHHAAGRLGAALLRVEDFVALCRPCHEWAGQNPTAAIESGISKPRVGRSA